MIDVIEIIMYVHACVYMCACVYSILFILKLNFFMINRRAEFIINLSLLIQTTVIQQSLHYIFIYSRESS